MNTKPTALKAATISLFLPLCVSLQARNTDSPTPVAVSPFQLDTSNDSGYYSANTTVATGFNRSIQDIPMAVDIINSEFIEDTGTTDLRELINIRGFDGRVDTRLGFKNTGSINEVGETEGFLANAINIERIEIARGPNAVLYGIGDLANMVNIVPKVPGTLPLFSASVGLGNDGYFRSTLEGTAPLYETNDGGVLSYRVAASYQERNLIDKTFIDGRERTWTNTYQISKTTTRLRDYLQYLTTQLSYTDQRWNVLLEGQFTEKDFTRRFQNPKTEEIDWLANIEFSPIENLTLSAGAFIQDSSNDVVENTRFNLSYFEDDKSEEYRIQAVYTFDTYSPFSSSTTSHSVVLGSSYFTYDYQAIRNPNNRFYGNDDSSTYLNYEGRFFDDRFTIIAGLRNEDRSLSRTYSSGTRNYTDNNDLSHQIALGYKLQESLNIYSSWSESSNRLSNFFANNAFVPSSAIEFGLKFEKSSTLTGRVAIYQTKRALFDAQEGTPEDNTQGYELDLRYAPSDKWEVLFDYTHENTEALNSYYIYGKEYDDFTRFFESPYLQGEPITPEKPTPYSGNKDTASLHLRYAFNEGTLNGFSSLLGIIYEGKEEADFNYGESAIGSIKEEVLPIIPEKFGLNLGLKYEWSNAIANYKIQFNINNFLDEKDYTIPGYFDPFFQYYTTRYYAPREYRLNFSIDF